MEALGMYRSGALSTRRKPNEAGAQVPLFLAHKNLKPFAEKHLGGVHFKPFKFIATNGSVAHGIPAEIIPKVCEVWMDAHKEGVLGSSQVKTAEKAEILLRAFAHVGIVALVDEATGFQQDRDRNALAKILEEFVARELQKWVSTFRMDYYEHLFRLWGQAQNRDSQGNPTMKRPQFFGALTNNIVYERLAPGVLQELRRRNPVKENGTRSSKHFQYLTPDLGHPKLKEHLAAVTALMRASKTKEQFMTMLDDSLPKWKPAPLFEQVNDSAPDASKPGDP
jgi:hypothetical protein